MIRFRFQEDERRFIRLHAEMFEKLARAGLSEVVGSDTLRNVGKIEQMVFMEGVRQGLAMAALVTEMIQAEAEMIPTPHAQKAFQLHALIYGSSDTPLRAVEKEWLGRLELDADHLAKSWLDDKPMRFAPATLQELEGTAPPIAPMMSVQAAHKPAPVKPPLSEPYDPAERRFASPSDAECPTCGAEPGQPCVFRGPGQGIMSGVHRDRYPSPKSRLPPPEAMHGAEVTVPEPWQKGEYEPDDDPLAPVADLDPDTTRALFADPDDDKEIQPESPEFLDIVRDAIQTMKRTGWDPKTWNDIILGLHRHMSVDAGFLDIQLTTHFGRTVLDQCGLAGLAPPDMMSFEFLNDLPGKTTSAPSSMDEPGEGSMGFGKAHGMDDEG